MNGGTLSSKKQKKTKQIFLPKSHDKRNDVQLGFSVHANEAIANQIVYHQVTNGALVSEIGRASCREIV